MPSASSGVGDDLGSTPYPSIREQETTAFVQVNRERLGIIQDSLEVVFTQFGGNIWKYETSADNPVLAPLVTVRGSQSKDSDQEGMWQAWFDNLLEQVPRDTKIKYLRDLQLPPENRNPAYGALGNALTGIAKFLTWMETTQPDNLTPAAQVDPKNFVVASQSLFLSMKSHLEDLGPNDPDYDRLTNVITQAETLLRGMQNTTIKGKE